MPESENQPFQNLRRALLNWYPFEKRITALLCGRNTDVLVPLLKAHVDNLEHPDFEQLTDIISQREQEKTFDLIVAADVLEFWQGDGGELLTRLVGRLKDDGILLLGFRNRFGIKYMCGGLDEAMQIPFSMLPPFSATSEEKPKLFAREEINGLLRKAGCSDLRYYYLMPDGEFPQVVFTDDLLPEGSFRDRVMPYDPFQSPLIACEKGLYDDVVREGMLPFTANYYLVECRKKEKKGKDRKVIHAALSTDRGPEHGFATVLYSDKTVEKIMLSPQGKAALKTLYENLENLRAHGLETVDQVLTEDRICMPLIREESSLQYLERNLASAPEAFLSVFERIIQDALKSSESFLMTDEEAKSAWGVSSGELGPILEKGYIDMIPYNAFWTGKQLRYYDQEFSRTNCPVKYILFRALRYTWLHIPEAETVFPLEEMKQRFGLEKLWERFQMVEDSFVGENRNFDRLRQLYTWTEINEPEILRRRECMLRDYAVRQKKLVAQNVHSVQLAMLKEFDRICRQNGLRYFAVHGTLLGAVRHGGFIPWDDDVDVAMLREDYERFAALAQAELPETYFFQTPENDPCCFYGGYGKLRDERTAALEPQNTGKPCNQGIWIDVFPLDPCPATPAARSRLQKRIAFFQRLLLAKSYHIRDGVLLDVYDTRISFYYLLRKLIPRKRLLKRLNQLCTSCRSKESRAILACYYGKTENRNIYTASDLENAIDIPFEDMRISVSANYEKWLVNRYGEHYMTWPPEEKRIPHHTAEFFPDQSYRDLI